MRYAFLGCGRMAGALIKGMLRAEVCLATDIVGYDIRRESARSLATETGIETATSAGGAAAAAENILVCVKPQDIGTALAGIKPALADKLVISIAAGVPLAKLQELSGPAARIVRVMPNTPALVGHGASAYATSKSVTARDGKIVTQILSSVGIAVKVEERDLDVVTGLSGSGPAYIYTVIEALAAGAAKHGLAPDVALRLAAQTTSGAARMVLETGMSPGKLREMVTSPGGTTLAGLSVLNASDVQAAFAAAVGAATRRSIELGKA